MKRCLSLLLTAVLTFSLTSCAVRQPQESTADSTASADTEAVTVPSEPAASTEPDEMDAYRTGTPWICSTLQGAVQATMKPDIKDDFALAVNRDYYLNTQIPDGYITTGTIYAIRQENDRRTVAMFENGTYDTPDSQLAKAYYDLQQDWDTRNKLGTAPFADKVTKLDSIQTIEEMNDNVPGPGRPDSDLVTIRACICFIEKEFKCFAAFVAEEFCPSATAAYCAKAHYCGQPISFSPRSGSFKKLLKNY